MFQKYYKQIESHDKTNPNLLLPHDAIFMFRLDQFEKFCKLIEDTILESGKSEKEVLLAGRNFMGNIKDVFPLVGSAVEYIIEINTK